jgi:hypothetical protein
MGAPEVPNLHKITLPARRRRFEAQAAKPMAMITDPLIAAGIVFFLGVAGLRLFQLAEGEANEMDAKMIFHLLLGPLCLAVLVLLLDGVADHFYLLWRLQP